MTFAQILFPVDFSERSIAAASHVEAIATQFGSKVTLMNVVDVMRACSVAVDFGVAYGYELDTVDVKNQIWSQLEEFAARITFEMCAGGFTWRTENPPALLPASLSSEALT